MLEGSFLACPLLSMAPDLNRNLAALSPAPREHQEKDRLCPSRAGTAGWLRSHPNKPRGIPYSKPKKAGKPSKGISAKTDHNLPKTFQGTFSIHSQSHPSPTRAVAVIVYHTAASGNRLPRESQEFSCCRLQTAQGARREGTEQPGETVSQREIRGMMHPATARQTVL